MHFVIETERLFLRCFTEADASLIYELNFDPEVTRYTYDPLNDLEQARSILNKSILTQYALHNFGRWAVHLKSSEEFIGWCGLKYRPETDEVDLGYRFKKQAWGKGYATETSLACIKYGFETLKLKRITGRAVIDNVASWKVLEKCGMTFIGYQAVEGYPHRTYEIFNPFIQ